MTSWCSARFSPTVVRRIAAVVGWLLCVVPHPANAQRLPSAPSPRFVVDRWTTADGLPSNYLKDLEQTTDGFLWIIASGTVLRFDGLRFRAYPELSAGLRPLDLAAAGGDTVYVLAGVGRESIITRWTAGRSSEVTRADTRWLGIAVSADGRLLAYGDDGLDDITGPAKRLVTADARQRVGMARFDSRGRVWVFEGRSDSLGVLEGSVLRMVAPAVWNTMPRHEPSGDILMPRREGDNVALLDATGRRRATVFDPTRTRPRLVDSRGWLWVTTGDALRAYPPDVALPIVDIPLPEADVAHQVSEDADGSIWVASDTRGLLRVRERQLQTLSTESGFDVLQVQQLTPTPSGDILAMTASGTAFRIRDGRVRREAQASGLFPVRAVLEDRRGVLWYAGNLRPRGGALVGVRAGREVSRLRIPDRVSVLALDPNDSTVLWAGAQSLFKLRIDGDRLTLLASYDVGSPRISSITFDSAGGVWAPGTKGLVRVTAQGATTFGGPGYPGRLARTLKHDADGTIWIGSYGRGLVRFRDGRFSDVRASDGLSEDVVSSILEDNAGNFWMGGNIGIHRVARAQLDSLFAGTLRRVAGVSYTERDGLANPEGSGREGLRDASGVMWFPTFGGVAVVNPRRVLDSRATVPTVLIDELLLPDGRRFVPDSNPVVLSPGQRRIEIAFSAADLSAPERLHFEYRLDGMDDAWVSVGSDRKATFTNLRAGRYRFRVRAVTDVGGTGNVEAVLPIVLEPTLVEANAFWFLLASLGLGGMVVLIRWRERTLRARAAFLDRQVAQRTAALAEETRLAELARATVVSQAERLRSLDEAKRKFFTNISHELRTPLTLILGPLKDIQRGRLGALPSAVDRELGLMLESGDRLKELVEQLLDLTRLDEGRLTLHPSDADIVQFLRRLASRFEPLARASQLDLHVSLPQEPVAMTYDRSRLEQVITNLLGNAVKFTPRGGTVSLSASDDAPDWFTIRVEDSGEGIAAENLAHVFDRFWIGDDSPRRRHEGAGVGLALARDIVELHGGTIAVESVVGRGSVMTVRLPRRGPAESTGREAAERTDETPLAVAVDLAAKATDVDADDVTTVLLVEDNAAVRAYLRRHLQEVYRVVEAADGIEGLFEARQVIPDLVICDMMMPQMDGETFCQAMRADPELDFVPIVMLTARASHDSMLEGLRAGADDYLTKPVDIEELMLRVHNQIASRRRLRTRVISDPVEATTSALPPWLNKKPHDAFLSQLHEVLRGHIGDDELTIDRLAAKLATSRSALYRRCEDALGRSPMDLLWELRLDQAAEWLRRSDANVAEIAYAVGFKSVPHFNRRFRERFSCSPVAFRREASGRR